MSWVTSSSHSSTVGHREDMESRPTATDENSERHHNRTQVAARHWMQKMREDTFINNIQNICSVIYDYVTSSDFIWQSIELVKKNMAEAPCSTSLYILMGLFGFLPVVCFFLFVCGTFILWLVCFIFCQAIAVTFAGALCGIMFAFIIVTSCIMATAFGMTVHTLSFMGSVYRVIAFNAPETMAFLRQQLGKFGIHLRLPEDDQT